MFSNLFKSVLAMTLLVSVSAMAQERAVENPDHTATTTGAKVKEGANAARGVDPEHNSATLDEQGRDQSRSDVSQDSVAGQAAAHNASVVQGRQSTADFIKSELDAQFMRPEIKALGIANDPVLAQNLKIVVDYSVENGKKLSVGIRKLGDLLKARHTNLSAEELKRLKEVVATVAETAYAFRKDSAIAISEDTIPEVAETYILNLPGSGELAKMTKVQVSEHFRAEENWVKIQHGTSVILGFLKNKGENTKDPVVIRKAQEKAAYNLIRDHHSKNENDPTFMSDEDCMKLAKEIVEDKKCLG